MRGAHAAGALVLASILFFSASHATAEGRQPPPVHPGRDVPFIESILDYSYPGGRDRDGRPVDTAAVAREIDRLAGRLRPLVEDRADPRRVVAALNRLLYEDEGFTYDPAPGDTDNYLPDRVLARRRGNCLGLTVLALAIGERLGLPLRAAYLPSHCFLRYEDDGVRINIETAEKGAEWDDARYARAFGVTADRPYLRSLGKREMIGVYLKSLGAACSRRGREEEALALYACASHCAPELPDVPYNAGVSCQKMGKLDEAIAFYRRALALDPSLAPARDNLGVALAMQGRYAEALEQARKAVALDPAKLSSRVNLAATFCACGMTADGIREFEEILAVDPGNARALKGLAQARRPAGR
ncbi:MAG: transglutaminase family protein [Gemmatimonadota bacterium]